MAKILILQEIPGALQALRKSLEAKHELHFVSGIEEALQFLQSSEINLIITRIHLENTNVFEFISTVKHSAQFSEIPVICFCGKRTEIAKVLNPSMAQAVLAFGADKYLDIDHFCVGDDCDFNSLRCEIEECLKV